MDRHGQDEPGPWMFRLYPEQDNVVLDRSSSQLDIVLVAGLGGHHIRTWQGTDKTVWPRDLLPKHVHPLDIRVLSFHYTTTLKGTTSHAGIRDHAKALLGHLRDDREDDQSAWLRPIIFVGHSLGGVIIKQALNTAYRDYKYRSLWEASRGVMFFATPHYMDKSRWEDFARHVLQCDAPVKNASPTPRMLAEVKGNSSVLERISEDFRPLQKELAFVTFRESDPLDGLDEVLVDASHGLLRTETEHSAPLPGDHIGLCKFDCDDEEEFEQSVGYRMKWLAEEVPKAIDQIPNEHKTALYSLCPGEFHAFFLDREPTLGTCEWITERPQFKEWLDNKPDKQRLWICAPPARGKSYLARHIINYLGPPESRGTVHCFLSDVAPTQRGSLQALLRATLQQALRLVPNLIGDTVFPRFEEKGIDDVWATDSLVSLWPEAIAKVAEKHPIVLLIDGFDEIKPDCQNKFLLCLEELEKLWPQNPVDLRLLLLSRPLAELEPQFDRLTFVRYDMQPEDTRNDIRESITEGFEHSQTLGEDRKTATIDRLLNLSGGVYLWAVLAMEELGRRTLYPGKISEALETLPQGNIFRLYDSIFERISQSSGDHVAFIKHVLLWITFQREGMRAAELNIGQALGRALEKCPDSQVINDEVLAEFLQDDIVVAVEWYCGQFVKIEDGRCHLVHRSLRDYLTRRDIDRRSKFFHMEERQSHAALANTCAAYLTMPYFQDSGAVTELPPGGNALKASCGDRFWEAKIHKRVRQHKFIRYAALYWFEHLENARGASQALSGTGIKSRLAENRRLLEDCRNSYAICWTEVWWFFMRWPRLDYPLLCPVERILREHLVPFENEPTILSSVTAQQASEGPVLNVKIRWVTRVVNAAKVLGMWTIGFYFVKG